jgi:hypothetical protein
MNYDEQWTGQRSTREIEVQARYRALVDMEECAVKLIDELPRCGVDDGGHGPCVKVLGHSYDHGANNWEWPNRGPNGNGERR